jgi:hypothetical protein
MKLTQFRKLIREEVRRVIKENIIGKLEVSVDKLGLNDEDPETNWESIRDSFLDVKKIKTFDNVDIYEITGEPYIVTVEDDSYATVFRKKDMPKIVAAIKDGSFFSFD